MATRYAAVPAVPQGQLSAGATIVLITALKENVELLTGTRGESDLASKAVAVDQIKVNPLGRQDMVQVSAQGLGFTVSSQQLASYDDYVKLVNDVQVLANDLFRTREAFDLLLSQMKAGT